MFNKPIPLKLLALLHILMPLFSLKYNAVISEMSFTKYLHLYWQNHSHTELMEFFTFSPLAGLLILSFSSWSYFIYFGIALWTMAMNTWVWSIDYSDSYTILVTANIFNLLAMSYLLVPSVRKIYLNPNLQWWKTPRRYLVDINEVIVNNDVRNDVSISNISKGGALIATQWQPNVGESLSMSFSLGDFDFSTDAEVVHLREGSFGVKFLSNTDIIDDALRFTKLEPVVQDLTTLQQVRAWMGEIKEGRGLFPPL